MSKPNKIFFLINQPYPFGMAGTQRVKLFAEHLFGNNNIVHVIIRDQLNVPNSNNGTHNGVSYSAISSSNTPKLIFRFFHSIFLLKFFIKECLSFGGHKKILIIYGDVDFQSFPSILLAWSCRFKIILDIVEDRSLTEEKSSLLTKINSWFRDSIFPLVLNLSSGLIVISSHLYEKYQQIYPIKPISLIPVSAANLLFDVPSNPPISSGKIVLIYCGSFGIKDGLSYLIEAFENLSFRYPELHLKLIPTVNKQIKKILNEIHNPKIELTGYLPEDKYWEELYSGNILCMTRINSPFANAGFPFKLGEYLATGKAVIATDVSDVSLYLNHMEDVYLATSQSSKSIEEGIEYFLNNRDQMNLIGANGLKKCKIHFNPIINNKKAERLINSILIGDTSKS